MTTMSDIVSDAMLKGYEHTAYHKSSIVWMKQYKAHVVLTKHDYQQLRAVIIAKKSARKEKCFCVDEIHQR